MQVPAKQLLSVCGVAFVAMSVICPGSASATEYEVVPPRVETAHWMVARSATSKPFVRGRTVTLMIASGYCIGEPKPEVHHVKVVERPLTKQRPVKSALITAYVVHPEYERPVPPPNTEHVIYNVCAGIGFDLTKRITLKRPVAELRLFDGSFSPPRKVWPRP